MGKTNDIKNHVGFYIIKRVDTIISGPFEVNALVLRLIKLFISWRSASYVDLDGEFCIVVKQVLNWLCIAVLFVIHISHRLALLLRRSKYELYRFCTGLHKV